MVRTPAMRRLLDGLRGRVPVMRVRFLLPSPPCCCSPSRRSPDARRQAGGPAGLVSAEFIYDHGPYPQVHASTLVETTSGQLLAAWFGGTEEGHADVEHLGGALRERPLVTGREGRRRRAGCGHAATRPGTPCSSSRAAGPLMLFYKVGPSPREWWGMVIDVDRRRPHVERAAPPARGHPRPDQEQAGAAGRRHDRRRVEHGGGGQRMPGACTSSSHATSDARGSASRSATAASTRSSRTSCSTRTAVCSCSAAARRWRCRRAGRPTAAARGARSRSPGCSRSTRAATR